MKKLLAAVLAAMFLFSTAALAETTANPQDRFLLICFEDAGTQTYALLGAGDGTQAFNAFAPESGTYETRFAGFWAAVSQLEPALTLDGKATSLAFLLGGNGNGLLVSLGGTIIAELNGTQAFLIASDSIAPEAISRAAGCDLRVWTPDGVSGAETDAASNLCPRCGQVDASAITFIGEKEGMSYAELNTMMNKKSGVQGLTDISSDMRDIDRAYDEGNPRAILARDMYYGRIKKFIGEYAAEMGGVDMIIFTGGVGENSCEMREAVCTGLEFMGVKFDPAANKGARGVNKILSAADSKVKVATIATNEELVIATDTYNLVK